MQEQRSELPGPDDLLVETFPRNGRWFLVAYCFEGRNAHQTLGMLLTRRMERFGYAPLGFVATDYVIATWSAHEPTDVAGLFEQDMLGDDLEAWMAESSMLRRTFRNVAVISGLVERNQPGLERTRKQVTVNTDLIYDVLRRHQPDHVLLRATRADAGSGLTDLGRLSAMLARVAGRVRHVKLSRVSPLAVPVLLDIGRELVRTEGGEDSLLAETEALVAEATGHAEPSQKPMRVHAVHRANLAILQRKPGQPKKAAPAPRSTTLTAAPLPPSGEGGLNAVPVRFAGCELLLDPLGGVVWPAAGLLAVADLHLEKGSAAAVGGSLVPPWDTAATLDRLAEMIARWRPATVVALGDSFHDAGGFARMAPADAARLQAMAHRARFVWVLGNHDPAPHPGLAGTAVSCWEFGGLDFCHQARPGRGPELVGHHHPKASIPTRAGTVTRPCFVADDNRLMLPALGAFTGGLEIGSPAIAALFPRGGRAFLLGQGRLFGFPLAAALDLARPSVAAWPSGTNIEGA